MPTPPRDVYREGLAAADLAAATGRAAARADGVLVAGFAGDCVPPRADRAVALAGARAVPAGRRRAASGEPVPPR